MNEYDELADLFSARDQLITNIECSEQTKTILRSALHNKINELMVITVKKFDIGNVFDQNGNGTYLEEVAAVVESSPDVKETESETLIQISDLDKEKRATIVLDIYSRNQDLSIAELSKKFDMHYSSIYKIIKDNERIVCDICGDDSFKSENGLKIHIGRIHKEEPDPEDEVISDQEEIDSEIYDLLVKHGEMDVGGLTCHSSLDIEIIKEELMDLFGRGLIKRSEPEKGYLVYSVDEVITE